MVNMWMIRAGNGAFLINDFLEFNIVAIGWNLGEYHIDFPEEIIDLLCINYSDKTDSQLSFGYSQIKKFIFDIKIGDYVLSYNPFKREYLFGLITSDYYISDILGLKRDNGENFTNIRNVKWLGKISRDKLRIKTKNTLGTINTIFEIKGDVQKDIFNAFQGNNELIDGLEKSNIYEGLNTPCNKEVEKYLNKWALLEDYVLQENSLNQLFFEIIPNNKRIEDILIKSSTLNDFYSTNIFSIFPVAKHIQRLNIDERLKSGDVDLVEDIANVKELGKRFYSFSTKYCYHHNPSDFPSYDNYIDRVLKYFQKKDNFSEFKGDDLRNYVKFKEVLYDFKEYYDISYDLKELNKYLWQLGRAHFPKKYY